MSKSKTASSFASAKRQIQTDLNGSTQPDADADQMDGRVTVSTRPASLPSIALLRLRNWLPHVTAERLKAVLVGVTCLLIVASVVTSYCIMQRQDVLQKASRYNVTFVASLAPVEVTRLEAAIVESTMPDSGIDQEEIQLRLEIVRNRINLFDNSEIKDFIQGRADLEATVARLRSMVEEAQPLIDNLGHGSSVSQLLALVSPLGHQLVKFAAVANTYSSALVARDQAQLSHLHTIFSAIIAGLIVCGFGLLGIVTWHNRLLRRAHAKVQTLVNRLQVTTHNLAAANTRVKETMSEVQLQNCILKERDHTLNTQNVRFDAALNNMSQALCMVDQEERVIVCNIRFLELFKLSANMVQSGMPIGDVFRNVITVNRFEREVIEAICNKQRELISAGCVGSFFQESSDGQAIAVSHQPMPGRGWVATYEDISERRRAEARIYFLAHHDALTCLPNRLLFEEKLGHLLKGVRREHRSAAVLCLDLDHFKNVNDALGHPAGDQLLKEVAQRLLGSVRDEDIVARLGGDEFAVLQSSAYQPESAEALAQRLIKALSAPYNIDGARVVTGTSIGIAIATGRRSDATDLLKNADMALYEAKGSGRGMYRLFEFEMDVQLQARRAMELDLREAIGRRELIVFYQPLFDLTANQVTGFEALLRWLHPVRGLVSPAQFIPLAEDIGLIATIGEWVLRQACHDATTWPKDITVAVNLSPVQFQSSNLVRMVQSALDTSGLPPRRLELEITESALLKDIDKVLITLHELRDLGVEIALDDFGTGYSSLSYLRSFPFHKIKIDQSFVREMGRRPDCRAIVHSVTQLAQKLGMATTAEGIETLEQLNQVREAGCTQAQGYYFDRPKSVSEISPWFTAAARQLKSVI